MGDQSSFVFHSKNIFYFNNRCVPICKYVLLNITVTNKNFVCSIRRRALDLLYGMCDVSNAKDIVEELLQVDMMSNCCFLCLIIVVSLAVLIMRVFSFQSS